LEQRRGPFRLNQETIVGNITGDHEDIGLFSKRVELVDQSVGYRSPDMEITDRCYSHEPGPCISVICKNCAEVVIRAP
jgi:hypothetical protein